ncbi:hypothetical protein [Sinosporangium siamense]|uniref:hypothetical protein n=1 Tax=Sinosporangium siamense TaxID=1367973 RepID=UPI0019516C95|nr:hypothetical protein [Sinosporangium siamense]
MGSSRHRTDPRPAPATSSPSSTTSWVSEQISKEQADRLVDLTFGGMLMADTPA